jgi:uncharacterized protein YkwD
MKKKLLIFAVLAVTLYIGAVVGYNLKTPVQATPVAQTTAKPPTVAELLQLVNAERAKYGVKPLKEDPRLDASAQYKASDMHQRDYFGHYDPSHNTVMIGVQMGYVTTPKCVTVSENIAWTDDGSLETAEASVNWWMHSKPHRTALLDEKYTLTGFGIIHDAVVEHFCQE